VSTMLSGRRRGRESEWNVSALLCSFVCLQQRGNNPVRGNFPKRIGHRGVRACHNDPKHSVSHPCNNETTRQFTKTNKQRLT